MTAAASLAANPALPLLAQREFAIGVALCVVALALIGIAVLLVRLVRLAEREGEARAAMGLAWVATFFALGLFLIGIPRVVTPRGMALGAQVYGQRQVGS